MCYGPLGTKVKLNTFKVSLCIIMYFKVFKILLATVLYRFGTELVIDTWRHEEKCL